MSNLTFVLSDETLNSYGFIVKTKGIYLERFKANPVMLYMHERESGVIGRWDNIRIEDGKLLADALFDESDPLGLKIKTKVEGGFIRSVSIGISDVVKETVKGVETVVQCVLNEVSIVDIPSNQNSVKLFKKGGKCVYSLSALDAQEVDLRSELIDLLELDKNVDDNTILETIKNFLKSLRKAENKTEMALRLGLADKAHERMLRTMEQHDPREFDLYIDERRKEQEQAIVTLVDKAIEKTKIIHYDRAIYEEIGRELGFPVLRKLLATLPTAKKPMDMIDGGQAYGLRAGWGLDEYRKFAPEELASNPELYRLLLKKEGKSEDGFTLEWYRKNDPDYLLNNPDIYERLLEKQNNTNT